MRQRTAKRNTLTAVAACVVAAAIVITASRCRPADDVAPVEAIFSCDNYTLYRDSVTLADGSSLCVGRDGRVIATDSHGRTTFLPFNAPDTAGIAIAGGDSLLVHLFNSPISSCAVGYDCISPYEIALYDAIYSPIDAARRLDNQINDATGVPVNPDCCGHPYPIVAPDAAWALAARETSRTLHDEQWLSAARHVAARLTTTARTIAFDPSTYLFRGASPLLLTAGRFPAWMNEADLAVTEPLDVNVAFYAALDLVATPIAHSMRDSLAISIDTYLRLPVSGYFTTMLYGASAPMQAPDGDNLAQAFAIIAGVASDAEASAALKRTPIGRIGIPTFLYDNSRPDTLVHRRALATAAAWAAAAARTRNAEVLRRAVGALAVDALTDGSDEAIRMLRAAIIRGMAGIAPTAEGLTIAPLIPAQCSGLLTITRLQYGEASLDIKIIGTGDIISEFLIDGTTTPSRLVPPTLRGHHSVTISLTDATANPRTSVVNTSTVQVPANPPSSRLGRNTTFKITHNHSDTIVAYCNGALFNRFTDNDFAVPADMLREVNTWAFAARGSGHPTGFTSRPVMLVPDKDRISIDIKSIARTGSRLMGTRRRLSDDYVESTRFKNASISFTYDAALPGDYYVQVAYLDGLGIVNPEMHRAMRTLTVNGRTESLIVFPQLLPEAWNYEKSWQTRRGITLPVRITLHEGENTLSLDYFTPADAPAGFNHDTNVLIPTRIILTRL